jgi:hypothetical protein
MMDDFLDEQPFYPKLLKEPPDPAHHPNEMYRSIPYIAGRNSVNEAIYPIDLLKWRLSLWGKERQWGIIWPVELEQKFIWIAKEYETNARIIYEHITAYRKR